MEEIGNKLVCLFQQPLVVIISELVESEVSVQGNAKGALSSGLCRDPGCTTTINKKVSF